MAVQADRIRIELMLPLDEYERVEAEARRQRQPVADMLPRLIEDGLLSRMSSREIMERVSVAYRARIATSGGARTHGG